MATTINPTWILSQNPKTLFSQSSYITPLLRNKLSNSRASSSSAPRTLTTVKCDNKSSEEREVGVGGGSLKEVLSGMVDERVEELLNREENRVLLDGLDKATERVEMAKRELAEIEKQEIEAKKMRDYIEKLEARSAEIAECQKEILEARTMVEEAERSLNIDGVEDKNALMDIESEEIDKNKERLESIKAAAISALVGSLAGLPISYTQVSGDPQLILSSAITFFSCALYGVVFRYAIRRDLDNFHLKSGTFAAFGVVKGLASLEGGPPLELEPGSLMSHAFNGAVYVSENLLIFAFAAIGLDLCYKLKLLSPFPIKKSNS